jgi:hypothetical protein
MLNRSKFLPVLALAAALSPLAANAWTGQVSNPGQAQAQLNTAEAGGQISTNSHGRSQEFNVPVGGTVSDATPQYANANHAVAGEGG